MQSVGRVLRTSEVASIKHHTQRKTSRLTENSTQIWLSGTLYGILYCHAVCTEPTQLMSWPAISHIFHLQIIITQTHDHLELLSWRWGLGMDGAKFVGMPLRLIASFSSNMVLRL